VRLGDGRVLVVAGSGPGLNPPNLSVCEVYDPTTTTWTAAQAAELSPPSRPPARKRGSAPSV
jgi:hypothetical protein